MTEAGYRLYDENSLKKLRQILFFRELEVSLSEIKAIMKDYENDNRKILETQKMMYVTMNQKVSLAEKKCFSA